MIFEGQLSENVEVPLGNFASETEFAKRYPRFQTVRFEPGHDQEGNFCLRVFARRWDLENYILFNRELQNEFGQSIKLQKDFFAELNRYLYLKVEGMFKGETVVGYFTDLGEARRECNFKTLRIGEYQKLPPVEIEGEVIIRERPAPRAVFLANQEEVLLYMLALEKKIQDNCVDYKCMSCFVENLENKLGG